MATTRRALDLLERLERSGVRLGLERIQRLLTALGNPQERLAVVLVGGSNGKGSTAALLSSMAVAAGYRTGLFTSPHLEDVRERMRLQGRSIGPGAFEGLLERVVATAESRVGVAPTYFEALTATAVSWFAEEEVDLAVLEVGLGGRLDATNVVEPVLSLITSISHEHSELLGDSLAAIAGEKAGILRPGGAALAWAGTAEVRQALAAAAARIGAPLRFVEDRVIVDAPVPAGPAAAVTLRTPEGEHRLRVGLRGEHQRRNLGLAVVAAECLRGQGWKRIGSETIRRGAESCQWPGRLEEIRPRSAPRVLLDCAHNDAGLEALRRYVETVLRGPFTLVFGALVNKRVEAGLRRLGARAESVILTRPDSPRARPPESLAAAVQGLPFRVEGAANRALERALADGRDVVACGSIYLIGTLRRRLRELYGTPVAAVDLAVSAAPDLRGQAGVAASPRVGS